MSIKLLNPKLNDVNDIDSQIIFFFLKFTNFLNNFKQRYELRKIDPFINKIHFIVKTIIKNDVLELPSIKNILKDYSEKNKLLFQEDNFINKYVSKKKKKSPSTEILEMIKKKDSPSTEVLEMIKSTNNSRNMFFNESSMVPYKNFKKKTLKKCFNDIGKKK